MTNYRVYLMTSTSLGVDVEAENADEAIDRAYEEGVGGLCAQCCGMGFGSNWFRDEGEDPEAYEVVNQDTGETEWSEDVR